MSGTKSQHGGPMIHVGMAPFVATVSEPANLPDGQVGIALNCGVHASRVVGRGGAKIHDIMGRTGATLKVTRNSGLCEITGTPEAVESAKRLVLETVEDGDTRDLRAAVSQALNNRAHTHGGLVVAASAPAGAGIAGAGLQWAETTSPPSAHSPFVPPQLSTQPYAVPLSLQ